MGFLDNSGDIILDAVLTDLGRKRLAEGIGFVIDKFAFGDDEIDYGLYDKTNTNGSAYYDISILQTPVLEAFTNNMSSMKSRLLSYSANDLLYLPVIMLSDATSTLAYATTPSTRMLVVDQTTLTALQGETGANTLQQGLFNAYQPAGASKYFEVDQGLNTSDLPYTANLDQGLEEGQYYLQIDNRLGSIIGKSGFSDPSTVLIDDDNIATYLMDSETGVESIGTEDSSVIAGPRGTRCGWKVKSTTDLEVSNFLFDQMGSQGVTDITNTSGGDTQTLAAADYKFIDSTIRVSGISTGYTLDIPIRFVKKVT